MRLRSSLLGGAVVLLSATTAATAQTTFSSGIGWYMQVNGASAGLVTQLQGVTPSLADVQAKSLNPQVVQKRIPSGAISSHYVVTQQPPMGRPMAEWLDAAVKGLSSARGHGELDLADHTNTILARWTWTNGTIADVKLPALSVDSKNPAQITVDILASDATYQAGNGAKAPTGGNAPKAPLLDSFTLQIEGLPALRVTTVAAYTVVPHGACSPLTITFSASDVAAFKAAGLSAPRAGTLLLQTADKTQVVFGLRWTGLHLTNLAGPSMSAANATIARATATFACDHVELSNLAAWTTI